MPGAPRQRFSRFCHLLVINAGLILLGVVALELIFGNWFASYVLPKPMMADRSFAYVQNLYEPPSTVIYRRDHYGLRGVRHPISEIELVTVGGSTTAQTFTSEGDTWQDVIHSLTGIVVANAGIDGMGSQSVREILEDWIQKIPGIRAKFYLHYVGINDASMHQTVAVADRPRRFAWSRRIRGRSAILQAVARLRERVSGPGTDFVSHRIVAAPIAGTPLVPVEIERNDILSYMEKMYKPTLRDILSQHQQRGETAIFVTQPTNPALVLRRGARVFVSKPELGGWAVALSEINKATETVCRESPSNCRFIDVAGNLSFEASDFYDLTHNTPQGARKLGEYLAGHLGFVRETKR